MPIVIHQRSPLLPRVLLVLSAAVLVWMAPGAGAKAGQHEGSGKERVIFPHMDAALGLLQQAQNQLEHAEPAFYGHRVKAMEHVKAGIVDLQTGINDYLAKHPSSTRNEVKPVAPPNEAGDPFPHMHAALRLLERARTELNEAAKVYSGKRVQGLEQVEMAIGEINAGISEYKMKHGKSK